MVIKRPFLTFASFIALGLNGVVFTFMGVSLPVVQSQLTISIDQAGLLLASLQAGFTVCTLLGGFLSDYFHREYIIASGCIFLSVGSVILCIVESFATGLAAFWCMGSGVGLILSGSNTLLVSLYKSHKGTILNIHHVFFGVGAIVGPALMGFLIIRGNQWRLGYVAVGVVLLLLCSVFVLSRNKLPTHGSSRSPNNRYGMFSLLGDGKFRVILLVNFLTMGSQVVIMLFGPVFLIQSKECSLGQAGVALSCFSLFIVLGRILCSKLATLMRNASIVLCLLWFQAAMLVLVWQGSGWFVLITLAISGITFSGTYPTLLALTSVLYPDREGSALGILSTMGGCGSIFLCWLTGYIGGLTSIGIGFIIIIIACSIALILFQSHYQALYRRESEKRIVPT
jgi:DHA1 family quinolone resistance protein-like MFS transporter